MGDELGDRPIEMACVAGGQPVRGKPLRPQALREQKDLEIDVEGAGCLIRRVEQIGKRSRVAGGPRRLRRSERRQRFGRDHPRRDGGEKALAEERAERLIFPRPECRARTSRSAGRTRRCGLPPPPRESARRAHCRGRSRRRAPIRSRDCGEGPKLGTVSVAGLRWPFGRRTVGARRPDGRGAAVIADRHVFVVRQQRIVGAEQLAGIGRVVNAGKEVGVVADRRGQLEAAVVGAMNEPRAQRLVTGAVRAIGVENLADPTPQGEPRVAAEREQRVQRRAGRGLRGLARRGRRTGRVRAPRRDRRCRRRWRRRRASRRRAA